MCEYFCEYFLRTVLAEMKCPQKKKKKKQADFMVKLGHNGALFVFGREERFPCEEEGRGKRMIIKRSVTIKLSSDRSWTS